MTKIVEKPLSKNSIFSIFFKKAFVWSRKPFFPSRISTKIYFKADFYEKQTMEKFRIFDKNRGPTPLEKFNFSTFFKKHFYTLQSLSFHLEYQQNIFLGNIGQENVFYDILERKHAFLGYKNKEFKKSKN